MSDFVTDSSVDAVQVGDPESYTEQMQAGRSKRKARIRYMTVTGLLASVAFILQFFEFAIPLVPSFIKMDFSDLPELIGAFALGPVCGVLVALIKNMLHFPLSQTAGVGELCNFLLGAAFALPAGLIYKYHKTRGGAVTGAIIGAVSMAALSFPINLFIVYPVYEVMISRGAIIAAYQAIVPAVQTLPQCLLMFNVPFTLFKAACSVAVTMVVYKKLSPILHG